MKKLIIMLMLVLGTFGLKAQQDTEISLYFLNGLLVNPGYTGSKEAVSINGWYRHQWSGFDGAPRTGTISMHAPLKKNQYALGVLYRNDQVGLNSKNSLYGSFAYRIPVGRKTKISMGLQAGFDHWDADLTRALLPDESTNGIDNQFNQDVNTFLPNVGAGVYAYRKNKYYVGVSVPHVIPFNISETLSVSKSDKIARLYTHAMITAGYVVGKPSATVKFLPSFLYKYSKRAPVNFDLTASFVFIDRILLGASMEFGGDQQQLGGESLIAVAKFAATKNLELGYSYDYTLGRLNNVNSGSHEVFVGYNFTRGSQRYVTPRFISYF